MYEPNAIMSPMIDWVRMALARSIFGSSPPEVANMKPPIIIKTKAKVPIVSIRMLIALRMIIPTGEVPSASA